jgi:DNA-binding CsgD family transcriptional regulator
MKQYEINGLLALGVKPKEIAKALSVSLSYVYRQRRKHMAHMACLAAVLGART